MGKTSIGWDLGSIVMTTYPLLQKCTLKCPSMSKHTTEVAAGDGANAADKARSLVPQDLGFSNGKLSDTFQMMSPQGIHREKHVAVHVRYAATARVFQVQPLRSLDSL